jgi:predicted TIM-barrel fold metal-dependent hydrolase
MEVIDARAQHPTGRRFYPVYVACCEVGVPFCTQIGHTGPLMPSEVGRPFHRMAARRFSSGRNTR